MFTIATSNTTGQKDTVVWNEIHHKTEAFSNHSGHGYPDPNYLDNVLAELASQGVEADSWLGYSYQYPHHPIEDLQIPQG